MTNASRKFEVFEGEFARSRTEQPPRIYSNYQVIEHGRGSNWIHPSLAVTHVETNGLGVVAQRPIAERTVLVVFGGKVITSDEFETLPESLQSFPYQIGDTLFLCPNDLNDIGIGERINHSCNPNSGFRDAIHLIAISDIGAGEEISVDYATCVSTNVDAFTMQCNCGAESCRNLITGQDWQFKEIQSRLLPYYQPYLQERVKARRKRERFIR